MKPDLPNPAYNPSTSRWQQLFDLAKDLPFDRPPTTDEELQELLERLLSEEAQRQQMASMHARFLGII